MYNYDYKEFKDDSNYLANKIKDENFDTIVAIARGGFALALSLSQSLNIRDLQSVKSELYDKDEKRDKIKISQSLDLKDGSKVLIVDDLVDSGVTLDAVLSILKLNYPKVIFKSATIFTKKDALVQSDFNVKVAHEWINFFWEADFSIN